MWRTLTVIVLMLAAGCASVPETAPDATRWEVYREHAAGITSWDLSAKVALRWRGGAESARLNWTQRGDTSALDLAGPFGAGAVRVTHADSRLQIERGGEQEIYDSSSPETLAAATGWPIPVAALPFWLRGLPDPEQALDHLSLQDGRAREIRQGGWVVAYADYTPVGDGSLPLTLRLSRAADGISLRLVNAAWTPCSP